MQPINTLSLAPAVNDWLTNSRQPHILHVFDQACNLINERREVLSVVTAKIGNGPFNLVIEDEILFSDHLNTQSRISIRANQLNLDDLTINIDQAKLWFSRPDWGTLYAKKHNITKSILTNYQKCGFDTPLDEHSGLLNRQNIPIIKNRFTNSLLSSIAHADISPSLTAAQQLAGLGIGLTPAGDDFILGAVLAAWIIHPLEIASVLAKEITNTAAPVTASLSAAYLRSAGKGEAGILWHNFFSALISGNSSAIQLQITKFLSVGHTSGADALAGFIGTFISYTETEIKHVIPKYS